MGVRQPKLKLHQVGAGLLQTFEATQQGSSLAADVKVLSEQVLYVLLVLQQLQHLTLQLRGRLLEHLVPDHQWDLVGQTLAGNLEGGQRSKTVP